MELSLLHLPNELFFEILPYLQAGPSFFTEVDTFNLSITCRRLYDALYPTILNDQLHTLRNMGLRDSEILTLFEGPTSNPKRVDLGYLDLKVLEKGNSFTSMFCRITALSTKEIWSLHGLLVRASCIGCVSLRFWDPDDPFGQPEEKVTKEWLRGLAAVLSSCAERVESALDVSGESYSLKNLNGAGGPFSYTISEPVGYNLNLSSRNSIVNSTQAQRRKPPFFDNLVAKLNELFLPIFNHLSSSDKSRPLPTAPQVSSYSLSESEFPSITSSARQSHFHPVYRGSSKLSCLKLHSSFMVNASWYPFTRQLLNQTPISILSFCDLKLKLYDWNQILPSLTIPTLAQFAIGNSQIAFPDLFSFLKRHPSITKLDLSHNTAIGRVFISPPESSFLPNLKQLVATPEYLIPFFKYPDLFPLLQGIEITQEAELDSQRFPFSQYDEILQLIAQRSPNVPMISTLSFRFIRQEGVAAWLLSSSTKPLSPNLSKVIGSVKRLECSFTDAVLYPQVSEGIVAWIATFPAVNELRLLRVFSTSSWEGVKASIWDNCRSLHSVELQNGIYYREST